MRFAIVLVTLMSCIFGRIGETCAEPFIKAMVVGSKEAPDPIVLRVEELKKQGLVSDVKIMESFPVQIHLKAPQGIIDELNRMQRIE